MSPVVKKAHTSGACTDLRTQRPERLRSSLWDPPPTDRLQTDTLWRRVRQRMAMASREQQRQHAARDREGPSFAQPTAAQISRVGARAPTSPIASDVRSNTSRGSSRASATTPQTSVGPPSARKSASPRVTDKNFRATVLAAHGITVSEKHEDMEIAGAYGHFGVGGGPETGATKEQVTDYYHAQLARPDSYVWLSLREEDARLIVHEYNEMMDAQEEEAKFAFYAKKAFFTQDVAHTPKSTEQRRTAYCKMEWAPRPDHKTLRQPPVLQPSHSEDADTGKGFKFENKPELTFWLPLLLFNPSYRDNLQHFTYVVPKAEVTAPYFTIDFKKADEAGEAAVNQLAAFSALVLYNRIELRRRRLESYHKSTGEVWNTRLAKGIKHYSISFTGDMVSIFLARPCLTAVQQAAAEKAGCWAGCTLDLLQSIKMNSPEKVIMLSQWINEIQCWGLGQYAHDLMLDVKGIFYKAKGGKDRVSLTTEEEKELLLDLPKNELE